jgi:hypothetical protein
VRVRAMSAGKICCDCSMCFSCGWNYNSLTAV